MARKPAAPSAPPPADADADRAALLDFLALEAPALLPAVDAALDGKAQEEVLLARVAELHRLPEHEAATPIFPRRSRAAALDRQRVDLEQAVRGHFERRRLRAGISAAERRSLLRGMLLTRAVDDHLKEAFDARTVRWGEYASPQKGFRSRGQEAIVGVGLRLRRPPEFAPGADYQGDVVGPMIRDLGVLLSFRPDPSHPILVQYGKAGTPVGGRDLHTGDLDWGVLPPAAPLAVSTQTLIGLAYAFRLRQEPRICVGFIGEGGSSLGEWHEAVNFAAVQRLPVVFVLENNQWALGTPVSEQSAVARFALKAAGYGIPGHTLDGNDPEAIAAATAWAAERARGGDGPTLLELVTYRQPGHAHHDDDRFHGNPEAGIAGYEDPEEAAAWRAADPVERFRDRLEELGELDAAGFEALQSEVVAEVAAAVHTAEAAPWPDPAVYRGQVEAPRRLPVRLAVAGTPTRRLAYDEAVRDALAEAMAEDDSVFVLGEDVGGRYGGAFGVTRGLAKRFGPERCCNTPLAESAIVGCAVGAALAGLRPVVEMQFADFLAPAFNALVNNAAKLHWRWGRPVPMVVRLPYGGATGDLGRLLGGGPFHSQCPEMWFLRVPGFRVVAPATPGDAKGLLLAAIRDENPVIFLEAKGLYGYFRTDLREEVPTGPEAEVPLGAAVVRRPGTDVTLITYGAMVWTALAAAEAAVGEGIDTEVLDLRSLWPLDEAAIAASLGRTGRVLILHEDTRRGGFAGELAARILETHFWELDAPLRRVTGPDTPVPYAPPLEYDFLPKSQQVLAALRELATL